ncbi:PRC-barrel domain-containing protein [Sphingomonas pseudosanguinis]|uniref:PRC-barrel domain-containing protein n=1 Tax=Sphingomonas pseudosanguinis TaxID=413712 RepID=UPI003F83531D
MTRTLFTTAALALAIAATPASAQLLGGSGGLGGSLGGSLGGAAGGTLGRSGAGELRADRQIDTRSGRVRAGGSAAGEGGTVLDGRSPAGSGRTETRGSGSASGAVDAQLIGTDAVRSTARGVAGEARGLAGRGREAIGGVRNAVGGAAGGVAGSGNGAANGNVGAGNGMLALAGSAAAEGAGSFDVRPGMNVVDARGRAIGTVRSLRSEADGRVRDVLVQVGDRVATLPAANFSGEGNVLVSAKGRSAVQRNATGQ